MYRQHTWLIAGIIFLTTLLPYRAQIPEVSAKVGIASSLNLGNVNNVAIAPYGSLWSFFSDSFAAGIDLRGNINQLVWNGLGQSQSILATDATISSEITTSELLVITTDVNYARGELDFSRWGLATDIELNPIPDFSLSAGLFYDKASYHFNDAAVNQSVFGLQVGFIPHLTTTTNIESGFSYSNIHFSTTQDSYSLYRLKGALRQQLGKNSVTVGLSWGGDSSDYDLYGIEGSFRWILGSGLALYNLLQLDYFTYDTPQASGGKGKKPPRPGSNGRKFNPQSTADSFVSFLWYASLAKTLDF